MLTHPYLKSCLAAAFCLSDHIIARRNRFFKRKFADEMQRTPHPPRACCFPQGNALGTLAFPSPSSPTGEGLNTHPAPEPPYFDEDAAEVRRRRISIRRNVLPPQDTTRTLFPNRRILGQLCVDFLSPYFHTAAENPRARKTKTQGKPCVFCFSFCAKYDGSNLSC